MRSDDPTTPEDVTPTRLVLLPDCHVQPGRGDEIPTQPTKRMYGVARMLTERYVEHFASADPALDAILLLGDTLDPADDAGLAWLKSLIESSAVPIHPIIGNHEVYGRVSAEEFHLALGLPAHGNYVARVKDHTFLMLATTHMDALAPGSEGYEWLVSTLAETDPAEDLFCCAHLSLLLHPCVQGWKNDGTQMLWAAEELLALLGRHPNVRAWIAGHKNVPSKVVRDGVLHLLSPQLIQTPCAYRVLEIHRNRIRSTVSDIEEQEIARWSDLSHRDDFEERQGRAEDRDFWWSWGAPVC